MTAPLVSPRLRVLCSDGDSFDRWRAVVDSAAALVAAEAVADPSSCGPAPSRDQFVLERAAATNDPVLVLPTPRPGVAATGGHEPAATTKPGPAGTRRILAPIDRTPAEHHTLVPLLQRAEAMGIEIEQMHVLAGPTRPPMWEGPGHHADAWLAQLRLHHQIGDATMVVRSGEPATAIRAASLRADLLVVAWNGDATRGRARVLRSLLRHARQPLLLVRVAPPRTPIPEEEHR
ncbi:MAG: universal stress protein [Actinomycetota bacterium]|jgi:nucleotide-binding universal stress UspA family protein|nr:universal stress protein [Actinomycetota bacterium]